MCQFFLETNTYKGEGNCTHYLLSRLRVQFPIGPINPVFKTMLRTIKIEGITRNKKKKEKKKLIVQK